MQNLNHLFKQTYPKLLWISLCSKHQRLGILFSIGCVLTSLSILLIVYTQLPLLENWQHKQATAGSQLHAVENIIKNQHAALKTLRHTQSQLAAARQQLPNNEQLTASIYTISNLLHNTQLQEVLLKPGTIVNKTFYLEVPIQLKLRGSYHHFGLFLEKLAQQPRLITVGNLHINRPPNPSQPLLISCTLTLYRNVSQPEQLNMGQSHAS